MAINIRHGLKKDFDPNKLTMAESASVDDTEELYHAFSPGNVQKLATYANVQELVSDATQEIADALTIEVDASVDYANTQGDYAKTQGDYAKAQGDYANTKGQQAQAIINSAAPIVNQNLQASYADKGILTGSNVQFTTADDGILAVQVSGKGTQQSPGTNKLPGYLYKVARTLSGITATPNSDGSVTLNGTSSTYADFYFNPNAAYGTSIPKFTLPAGSFKAISTGNDNVTIILGIGSTAIWSYGTTLLTKTLASATDFAWIILRVAAGTTLSNFVVYPQIELGTVSTPYNKYVPLVPDPDYSLPITHLGDAGSFIAGASGKNILDVASKTWSINANTCTFTKSQNGLEYVITPLTTIGSAGIYTTFDLLTSYIGKTVTISFDVTVSSSNYAKITIFDVAINKSEIPTGVKTRVSKTYTLGRKTGVIYIDTSTYPQLDAVLTIGNIQLELGTVATPYEACKGNTVTVNAVGRDTPDGVCDVIDVFNKKKTPNINALVVTGTEAWTLSVTNVAGRSRFLLYLADKKISSNANTLRCTHFNPVSWGTLFFSPPNLPSISGHDTANAISIAGAMFDTMTQADFKAWLAAKYSAGDPVIVEYQVASPVPVDINVTPNNCLMGYKGITNAYTTDPIQPVFTAIAKSELWSKDYLLNGALTTKQDKGTSIIDANGNELIKFPSPVTNAVNEITISNSVTGSPPAISASGNDTNISLNINSKGTGTIRNIVNGVMSALFDAVASAVNYFTFKANTTGNAPTILAIGTDTNIDVNIVPKGTGKLKSNGTSVVLSPELANYSSLVGITQIAANSDLNNASFKNPGNYYCLSYNDAITVLNIPGSSDITAFVLRVSFGTGNAYPIQQLEYCTGAIYRRYFDPYISSGTWQPWKKALFTTDLVNTDTQNVTDKPLSANVGYSLGLEIDDLKGTGTNFASVITTGLVAGAVYSSTIYVPKANMHTISIAGISITGIRVLNSSEYSGKITVVRYANSFQFYTIDSTLTNTLVSKMIDISFTVS